MVADLIFWNRFVDFDTRLTNHSFWFKTILFCQITYFFALISIVLIRRLEKQVSLCFGKKNLILLSSSCFFFFFQILLRHYIWFLDRYPTSISVILYFLCISVIPYFRYSYISCFSLRSSWLSSRHDRAHPTSNITMICS